MSERATFRLAICPLYDFFMPEILTGKLTPKEALEYFRKLHEEYKKGFEIFKNVKIRRVKNEDLEKIQFYKDIGIGLWSEYFVQVTQQTFVIEIIEKGKMDYEAIIKKLLLALRLCKRSDVYCKLVWFEKGSKVNSLMLLDSPVPPGISLRTSPTIYKIEDIDETKKIANKIDQTDFGQRKSFSIACERYSRSFEENRRDDQIIDLCIAFEALFKGEPRARILFNGIKRPEGTGKYIGLGCSMLLGKDYKEREKIQTFLVETYKLRNKIIHGVKYDVLDPFSIDQLQEYLREAIISLL